MKRGDLVPPFTLCMKLVQQPSLCLKNIANLSPFVFASRTLLEPCLFSSNLSFPSEDDHIRFSIAKVRPFGHVNCHSLYENYNVGEMM